MTLTFKVLWAILALLIVFLGIFFALGLIPAPQGEVKKVIPYSQLVQKK